MLFRSVITALEVIEASFVIVIIASIANGVHMGDMIGVGGQGKFRTGRSFHRCDFPISVVLIGSNQGRIIALRLGIVASIDRYHVALQILRVIIAGRPVSASIINTSANSSAI